MVAPAAPVEWNSPVVAPPTETVEKDAGTPIADLFCLYNADLPECRPLPQTTGLGRG